MLRFIFFNLLFLFSVCMFSQSDGVRDALRNYRYNEVLALLETEPPTRENLLLKAYCHEKLQNHTSALDIYMQLLDEYPDDVDLAVSAAECASQAGNSPLSLQYWTVADSLSPDNQFIRTRKAMAFYRNNNWKQAIEQAKTVFEADSVPLLLRMAGDAFLYSNEADSAIWYYYKAIDKNPADHLAVDKLGKIFLGAKLYDPVINLTQAYLDSINPDQQLIGQLNGMAHYSAGNYAEAARRLKANIVLGDSSYTTRYYLGMSLYASKLYFEAVPWLEGAYNLDNSDVNLLYYYGTALSRTYDRKRGIEVLEEGVEMIMKLNGMLFDFDRSFADAYMRSGNYTKAISYFQSAYKRDANAHSLLYNIGYCYESMKDYKNAAAFYERFLKTAPPNRGANDDNPDGMESGGTDPAEALYKKVAWHLERVKEELFFQSSGEKPKND